MSAESVKTAGFVFAALVLVAAAAWIEPGTVAPEAMSDEGEPLFPQFRDVMDVKAIEVIAYNEDQATATPLKVEFRNGRWIMPSHYDYPAEARDRLDKTAGALLGLKKDLVISDRLEDHARYGVIDPLDMKVASLTGRGKRVTLRNANDEVLADIILGKPVEDHPGYRYVRLPGRKRVYGVKTAADPSARFEDWVEGNLLRLSAARIRKITINSYSIDETLGRVTNIQRVVATRDGSDWTISGTRRVSTGAIRRAASALASIRIVGARPKPRTLAEQFREGKLEMTLEAVMSLRRRGFFLSPMGRLLSNEGEMIVETDRGLVYTLRFGEIVAGAGRTSEAAPESGGRQAQTPAPETAEQNRYLLVTVRYDPQVRERYGGPSGGERAARFLSRKFSGWYYVISGEDFKRLRAW